MIAVALGVGCTSEPANRVGEGLTDIGLDSALVPLTLWEPASFGQQCSVDRKLECATCQIEARRYLG